MSHEYRDMPGAGTILQIEIGYSYVDIPGCTDISIDGFKRGVRTPTHLTSPGVVKKPGMTDFGQTKCKVFFDANDATHQEIRDRLIASVAEASRVLDNFKIIYPDGYATPAHVLVTGFVADFSHASGDPETGTWTADMMIENTTATWTAGSPAE